MKSFPTFGLLIVCALLSGCATLFPGRGHQQQSVWVCHGGRNPKWQRVSASAADAHRRHGDRVSEAPQRKGERC